MSRDHRSRGDGTTPGSPPESIEPPGKTGDNRILGDSQTILAEFPGVALRPCGVYHANSRDGSLLTRGVSSLRDPKGVGARSHVPSAGSINLL